MRKREEIGVILGLGLVIVWLIGEKINFEIENIVRGVRLGGV